MINQIKIADNCIVYANELDANSRGMLTALCNSEIGKESRIRVMPDVHAGPGCVIGTSMITKNKLSPILLGGDIGCGVTAIRVFPKRKPDLAKLDKIIRFNIPSGSEIREERHIDAGYMEQYIDNLTCASKINKNKALRSIATLGGGNHFIELGVYSSNGNPEYWLIVHSGSRHLGVEVSEYHKKMAALQHPEVPYEFAYVSDEKAFDFYNDVLNLDEIALFNRYLIISIICTNMNWKQTADKNEIIDIRHNSVMRCIPEDIDTIFEINKEDLYYNMRKGCIPASEDRIIIPMNMRDGCAIGVGCSSSEYNWSAPHGAGRIMTRTEAKDKLTLTEYKKQMEGIFTTSVSRKTIDESPMAYKSVDTIVNQILGNMVTITGVIKPIYNFKPEGED